MITLSPEPLSLNTEARAGRLRRVLYAALLDPGQKFGSLEEQVLLLARAFSEEGSLLYPLFLCPPGPGKTRVFDEAGVQAACLDLTRFRFATLKTLVRLIRDNRIEIINWNFTKPIWNTYLWWLTVLTPRVTHYFTDHTSRASPKPGRLGIATKTAKRLLLKRYGKVVCVSQFVLDWLKQEGCWSNLECHLHFINADRFCPDEESRQGLRAQLGDPGRFVLVAVANLIPDKGIDVALRALARLPEEIVLWVLGSGPDRSRLEKLQQDLDLGNRVRFFGRQANVTPYMQAADCLLCPSLWQEAAGLCNIEAQACGLPLIASCIGGIPEYARDGQTGLLFRPGDAGELASCVRRLYENADMRHLLGRQARAFVVENFAAGSRLKDLLDIYREPCPPTSAANGN